MVTYREAHAVVSLQNETYGLRKWPYGSKFVKLPEPVIETIARKLAFGQDLESCLLRNDWGFKNVGQPELGHPVAHVFALKVSQILNRTKNSADGS